MAKNERMEQYLRVAQPLLAGFKCIQITHVRRPKNQIEDALANLEKNALYPCNMELSVMEHSSTLSTTVTTIDYEAGLFWMTPIEGYMIWCVA